MRAIIISDGNVKRSMQDVVDVIAEVVEKFTEVLSDFMTAVDKHFRETMKRRKFSPITHLGAPCAGYPGKIRRCCRSNC